MCRADEVSIKKGFGGEFKGEFIPRWVNREMQKQKACCCVPECSVVSERLCAFASFDTICAASNVDIDPSVPLLLPLAHSISVDSIIILL